MRSMVEGRFLALSRSEGAERGAGAPPPPFACGYGWSPSPEGEELAQ